MQDLLRIQLQQISQQWRVNGLPSAETVEAAAVRLDMWKKEHKIKGLWDTPPLMVTATLDDGLGQGLSSIHRFAAIAGLNVHHLGLLQSADSIITACQKLHPDFVGLTILQLDTDEALARVGHNLPPGTRLVAGGPAFKYDPEMASRCGVAFVALNVAYFIDFLCQWCSQ
jgi:methylmalonyl-CoA mutase cobalamin-binding subunit